MYCECDLGPDNCLSRSNGVHTLTVGGAQRPIKVYCDGGWAVCVTKHIYLHLSAKMHCKNTNKIEINNL